MLKEEVLENREHRDLMDRVMDKGIVVDPADRIGMAADDYLDQDDIVIGTIDTRLDKEAA